jgi:hypothetical protein
MNKIKELEAQLQAAKKEQQKLEWEEYLNTTEKYLKSLIGKTFMRPYQNGRFIMFKVSSYSTQYYIDKDGFYGQFSPFRWFELKSSSSINCNVKDSSGRWFRPEIKYTNLQFNRITGKNKNKVETSGLDLIDYENEKYTSLPEEIRVFGKLSYNEGIPNFKRDINDFSVFLREVPENMWKEAKKIADENIIKTKLFWDKYESIIKQM